MVYWAPATLQRGASAAGVRSVGLSRSKVGRSGVGGVSLLAGWCSSGACPTGRRVGVAGRVSVPYGQCPHKQCQLGVTHDAAAGAVSPPSPSAASARRADEAQVSQPRRHTPTYGILAMLTAHGRTLPWRGVTCRARLRETVRQGLVPWMRKGALYDAMKEGEGRRKREAVGQDPAARAERADGSVRAAR